MPLLNSDFELEWSVDKSHKCRIFPVEGEPYDAERDNIFTPSGGWKTFFIWDEGTYDQPEVRDAWLAHDTARVFRGKKATLLFSFYRKHDAGFLQQVPTLPGDRLTLNAFAHGWSNCHDRPNTDDARWSEGPGFGPGFALWGEYEGLDLTNGTEHDWRNMTFWLGIDPTGGTDPRASSVVWGLGAHIYNIYMPVPEVTAIAVAPVATVFLRCRCLHPFKHNDNYWDDVRLTVDDSTHQDGDPRVPYKRTFVLAPRDATLAEMHMLVDKYYKPEYTIGRSADDAGIGRDLLERNILAYRPSSWPGNLRAFFEEHYPGANYIPIGEEPPPPNDIMLKMNDPRWAGHKYAGGRCYTIVQQGCWICDTGMGLRWYDIDPFATPLTVDAAVGSDGYDADCSMTWVGMKRSGLECTKKTTNFVEVRAWLGAGNICFAEVSPVELQHFVMVTEHSDAVGDLWMFDPLTGYEGWLKDKYPGGVDSYRLIRPYEEPEPPPPPPPPQGPKYETISVHIQTYEEREELNQLVTVTQPGAIKLVEGLEQAWHLWAMSPFSKIVFRHCVGNQSEFLYHPGGYDAGAEAYIDTFRDSLLENADPRLYVESLNEEIPTDNMAKVLAATRFDVAFCHALQRMGSPARPVVLTAGVGNPQHGPEVRAMTPAVRAAIEAGGAVGPHVYWGFNRDTGRLTMTDGDWKHYAGRPMESWDPEFVKMGLKPFYIFGEGGPIAIAETGNWMNVHGGWRHPACLNGDRALLIEQIMEFRRRVAVWNAAHGHRVLGLTLFTVYGFGWEWFQYRKEEMKAMRIAFERNPI